MVESEVCEIPSELIRSVLRETVETKLNSKKCKIEISSASKAGTNNFVGIVYRASFCKEDENEKEENPIHKMIVKVAPMHLARREIFISRPAFLREIYMYEKVLPYFREFEESKGVILEENGFIEYPQCYRTLDIEPSECIFMEDLSVRGFKIIDRCTEQVTADHVRLGMKALGKFHAISFAMKDQQPEKFKELASNLSELFVRRDDKLTRDYFNKMLKSIYDALDVNEDVQVRSKLDKLFEREAMDITADCVDSELTGSAAIITHGDNWQNNQIYKYDQNGKPIEVVLLDWQISRYCSPIIDIVYFVFCCTTKELRDAHYDEFLKVYHESLCFHIQKLGSDPDKLFPFDLMLEHLRKFGKFGLIMATALLPMLTSNGQGLNLDEMSDEFNVYKDGTTEMPEVEDMPTFITEDSQERFNERMRGVAIDMVRLGYV